MGTDVVLLVDDNIVDVAWTLEALRSCHVDGEIVVVHDGVEALDLLLPEDGRTPLRPVILMTDIRMPRVGGLELVQRLRANPSTMSLPVIMLTSSIHDRDVMRRHNLGADSYVQKPVGPEALLDAANALGVHWSAVVSAPAR